MSRPGRSTEYKPEDASNINKIGCFCKGLPNTGANKKGTKCRGGKQAEQCNTWAFLVNAASEKEDPIVIGQYVKLQCSLLVLCPYGCWYHFNNRAWIPGGTQKSFIRGGSTPRSNPLPFYIPFFQKRYPFRIPFIGKRRPFHIPS